MRRFGSHVAGRRASCRMKAALRHGFTGSSGRCWLVCAGTRRDIGGIGFEARVIAEQCSRRESSEGLADNRPGGEQLQDVRALRGEKRRERPDSVELKFMGDFTNDAPRHRAKLFARSSHEGLFAEQIQDARDAARIEVQSLHRFRMENRGLRIGRARHAEAIRNVAAGFLER